MKKGNIYEGVVKKVEFPNKAYVDVIEKDENGNEQKTLTLVKGALPGQKIKFRAKKVRKDKSQGILLEVTEKSPLETAEPMCCRFGKCGGCIGEVSALCLLIGGAYLLVRRVIAWQIPTAFLGTVALLTLIFHKGDMSAVSFMASSLFSGGLMLGAFFMATDYVTSPVTPWGRVIYGVGCGALVVFLRFFSGYPEGVSFAILIMNALVWYIELLTKPRVYGKARGKGERKHGNG